MIHNLPKHITSHQATTYRQSFLINGNDNTVFRIIGRKVTTKFYGIFTVWKLNCSRCSGYFYLI